MIISITFLAIWYADDFITRNNHVVLDHILKVICGITNLQSFGVNLEQMYAFTNMDEIDTPLWRKWPQFHVEFEDQSEVIRVVLQQVAIKW